MRPNRASWTGRFFVSATGMEHLQKKKGIRLRGRDGQNATGFGAGGRVEQSAQAHRLHGKLRGLLIGPFTQHGREGIEKTPSGTRAKRIKRRFAPLVDDMRKLQG